MGQIEHGTERSQQVNQSKHLWQITTKILIQVMQDIKTIRYTTDKDKGPTLTIDMAHPKWVELLKKYTGVYFYQSMPQELYDQWRNTTVRFWNHGHKEKNLGRVRNLTLDRLRAPFVMPLFGRSYISEPELLTCGSNRFVANLANGVGADAIPLILLSDQPPTYPGWEELASTDEFNNLFQLNDIDYEIIVKTNNNVLTVSGSKLRHSDYDVPDQARQYAGLSESVLKFWEKFTTDDKIHITIFCTEKTRSFIQESPLFNIKYLYQKPDEWQFSFGKILGADKSKNFISTGQPDLYLWLYDITEPVHICLLLLWANTDNAVYYSNNKKSVLIDTSHGSSILIIGDWVK